MSNKVTTILVEDDCAPDAGHHFRKQFQQLMGVPLGEWKSQAQQITPDGDYAVIYEKDGYRLSSDAGEPWWVLSKIEQGGLLPVQELSTRQMK